MNDTSREALLKIINTTPLLQSFLYDVNLLPEELQEGSKEYGLMLGYAFVYQAAQAEQAKLIAELVEAAERKRLRQALTNQLNGIVMSKYASKAECEAARAALRNAMLDVCGA